MLDVLYELKHSHMERDAIAKTNNVDTLIECITNLIDVTIEEHDHVGHYILDAIDSYMDATRDHYECQKNELENIIKKQQNRIDSLMTDNFNLSMALIKSKRKEDQ